MRNIMAKNTVTVQRTIPGTASSVYGILRDYETKHPQILPPAFENYRVESGGLGAGTVVAFDIKAGGRARSYRMEIEEPQIGNRMIERDLNSSLVTTYTVMPHANGATVRIETTWDGAKGIGGFFEKLFAPKAMQGLYNEVLERLEEFVKTSAAKS
jgi:hypothetical protein